MKSPGIPVALVAAVASNAVIGREGQLPWHLSSDLRRFRQLTMGKPLVMGRRTCESIGRALPGRDNIVISSTQCTVHGVQCVSSLEQALALADDCAHRSGAQEIAVIGGARVFSEALPLAHRLYLTEVLATPLGDRWMPTIDFDEWQEVERLEVSAGAQDDHPSCFRVLHRLQLLP